MVYSHLFSKCGSLPLCASAMACSLLHRNNIFQCGGDPDDPGGLAVCVPLSQCTRDVTDHLQAHHISSQGLQSEEKLILARVGIFGDHASEYRMMTVCPSHRGRLGLHWKHNCTRYMYDQEPLPPPIIIIAQPGTCNVIQFPFIHKTDAR